MTIKLSRCLCCVEKCSFWCRHTLDCSKTMLNHTQIKKMINPKKLLWYRKKRLSMRYKTWFNSFILSQYFIFLVSFFILLCCEKIELIFHLHFLTTKHILCAFMSLPFFLYFLLFVADRKTFLRFLSLACRM